MTAALRRSPARLAPGEQTRLRVTESGLELRSRPEAEKQRYADEHQGGWGEFLDRLAVLVAKHPRG